MAFLHQPPRHDPDAARRLASDLDRLADVLLAEGRAFQAGRLSHAAEEMRQGVAR